jgi:3-deoxy-7-phosphoheptulonate synthase
MAFEYIQPMPGVEEIKQEIPVSPEVAKLKEARDKELIQIIKGESDKFILIIGPCSAHSEDAVLDYVNRLARLREVVQDKLFLVPRIYTNKPRTTGEGYKGMGHQPDPSEKPDMFEGLKAIRRMHIKALAESHLSAADEMLYPGNYPYLEDLLTYVAVGARSVENQQHRLTISGLDVPSGMKNPPSGDIDVMLNAIKAAQIPHDFVYNNWAVKTSGNPLTHAILRGSINHYGQNFPNYHYEDLIKVAEEYQSRGLEYPCIIVDTNHANSNKCCNEQPRIAKEILHSRKQSGLLKNVVKGLMIESFIEEGTQKISDGVYGKSITDPCLGWEDTVKLVRQLADSVD